MYEERIKAFSWRSSWIELIVYLFLSFYEVRLAHISMACLNRPLASASQARTVFMKHLSIQTHFASVVATRKVKNLL
jgi:hypothetical protein